MNITLQAQSRQISGKKVAQLRRDGLIPAVLFGKGLESRDVVVPALEYSRVERRLSPTTLMDVAVDGGAPIKALLHKVQIDPRSLKPIHLELFQVRMEDKMKVEVALHLEGIAPAVSELGALVVLAHNSVEIRASPDHLMSSFHVDVSGLHTLEDHVRAGDLKMPEGVELLTDPDDILVSVVLPSIEVVEEVELPEGEEGAAPAEPAP